MSNDIILNLKDLVLPRLPCFVIILGETLLQRTTIFLTYFLLFFPFFRQVSSIVFNNFPFYLKYLDIFKNCFYPKSGNLLNWFSSFGVVLR